MTQSADEQRPAICAGIITKDGAVLLVQRREREGSLSWQFPAGELEPGESVEAAAVRETAEETGLTVRPLVCWASVSIQRQADGWHTLLVRSSAAPPMWPIRMNCQPSRGSNRTSSRLTCLMALRRRWSGTSTTSSRALPSVVDTLAEAIDQLVARSTSLAISRSLSGRVASGPYEIVHT